MKRFTGQSKASEMSGLANSVANGDVCAFAGMINESLKRMSDDLQPLPADSETTNTVIPDDYTILPETVVSRFERITIHKPHKAPGPDELPNGLLRDYAVHRGFASHYVQFSMLVCVKEMCRRCGRKPTCYQCRKSSRQRLSSQIFDQFHSHQLLAKFLNRLLEAGFLK